MGVGSKGARMRKFFSHGEKGEKKIFSVRFSLRNEKKDKNINIRFFFKYIAQMASSRSRTNFFTDRSNYRGIGQLTDHLID